MNTELIYILAQNGEGEQFFQLLVFLLFVLVWIVKAIFAATRSTGREVMTEDEEKEKRQAEIRKRTQEIRDKAQQQRQRIGTERDRLSDMVRQKAETYRQTFEQTAGKPQVKPEPSEKPQVEKKPEKKKIKIPETVSETRGKIYKDQKIGHKPGIDISRLKERNDLKNLFVFKEILDQPKSLNPWTNPDSLT